MKKVYTKEVAKDIVEVFEDLLEEYGIDIPDECREGDECEGRLYGFTYSETLDNVERLLIELMEMNKIKFVNDKWNLGNWMG